MTLSKACLNLASEEKRDEKLNVWKILEEA